jgi:hypothetical protein
MWVVLLILILIVLSVMFGGFQKGTKTGSLNHFPAVTFTFSSAPSPLLPHQ